MGGIFSGMISRPSPEEVTAEIGDKVIDALRLGVSRAKEQFREYQQQHPDWLANNAKRTVADLIHDWMWAAVVAALTTVSKHPASEADETTPHVTIIDRDPLRELSIRVESEHRLSYLIRLKRHHMDGATSSYQPQTVIDFELQGRNQTFPGFGEVRLEAGYEWDEETRAIGTALITLRDGRNNVIWTLPLSPDAGSAADGVVTRPTTPEPVPPVVGVPGEDETQEDQDTGSDQP